VKKTPDPRGATMDLMVFSNTAKTQLVCEKGAINRKCPVPVGQPFSVDVKTGTTPDGGFQGYQIVLRYSSNLNLVQQPALTENSWPNCPDFGFEQKAAPTTTAPGRYILGCKAGPPPKDYKGPLANIHFTCKGGTGQIDLVGGAGSQVSFYDRPSIFGNRVFLVPRATKDGVQVADSVRINCGEQGFAGLDTDGDGCSDLQEQSKDVFAGGLRDPLNPWDFFDPTGDQKHRLDDILAVIKHYFTNKGGATYSTDADRTLLGPNYWNLGAPNGYVRLDDILSVIKLYFHDCA
jgi:hypothetical protein